MTKYDIDKAYISPFDRFLFGFDCSHEKSASQSQEIKKYQRIFLMRDKPQLKNKDEEIWNNF